MGGPWLVVTVSFGNNNGAALVACMLSRVGRTVVVAVGSCLTVGGWWLM
jgi:hypothetical protein